MSASQWFLRGFRVFQCRIDAFVYRRVRRVRKGVNLILRVVWIVPGLRFGRKIYRNDAPRIAIVIAIDFDDRIWLRIWLKKLYGFRVVENGLVDLCVPYLDDDVASSFGFRIRDPESACTVIFIPDEVSNVCSGPVFPCRAVGVLKPGFVEDIAPTTVCRQVCEAKEVV